MTVRIEDDDDDEDIEEIEASPDMKGARNMDDVVLQIDGEHDYEDTDSAGAMSDARSELSEGSKTPRRREGLIKRWGKALFGKNNKTPKSSERKQKESSRDKIVD